MEASPHSSFLKKRQLQVPGTVLADQFQAHVVVVLQPDVVGHAEPPVVGGIRQYPERRLRDTQPALPLLAEIVPHPSVVDDVLVAVPSVLGRYQKIVVGTVNVQTEYIERHVALLGFARLAEAHVGVVDSQRTADLDVVLALLLFCDLLLFLLPGFFLLRLGSLPFGVQQSVLHVLETFLQQPDFLFHRLDLRVLSHGRPRRRENQHNRDGDTCGGKFHNPLLSSCFCQFGEPIAFEDIGQGRPCKELKISGTFAQPMRKRHASRVSPPLRNKPRQKHRPRNTQATKYTKHTKK